MKTYIWGSCVSRDTFSVLSNRGSAGEHQLIGYIARQSWISNFSNARSIIGEYTPLESQFQQRMVTGDAKGGASEALILKGAQCDIILIDLIDERGGVVCVDDKLYVTYLSELRSAASNLLHDSTRCRIIPFGTDEHFALWSSAARCITSRLSNEKLLERVVCLAPHWAKLLDDGTPFNGPAHLITADEAEIAYSRYYNLLEKLGISLLTVPEALCRTTLSHQWGVNYFHYIDQFYEYIAEQLLSRFNQ